MKAFKLGFSDGYIQPIELTMGMTYSSNWSQFCWDMGANLGQFFGKVFSNAQR
jgi:hypothetical protein